MIKFAVGMGSCGIAAGADEIYSFLFNANVDVVKTGCIGICTLEPILDVYIDDERFTYVNVNNDKLKEIYDFYIKGKGDVRNYLVDKEHPSIKNHEFIKKQARIVLKKCGDIDPESIDDYMSFKGYEALKKVINMPGPDIIEIIKKSKLRGRGGAGFYTYLKWLYTYETMQEKKYVFCNADEGDPGAFMDRAILEGDPHAIIEGILIAAKAIGATKGYIYIRKEYPLAVERLKIAIAEAKKHGFLGENILGTDFSFEIKLKLGAGAFVCGEETALIESTIGRRGEPRVKPPFPAESGLRGRPTLINNVETFANIAPIINNGPEWFLNFGTSSSGGTKVFSLAGDTELTGLVEVPFGTTLHEIIYDIAGGMKNGRGFKMAQTGGPSGGCIPASHLEIEMDYETLHSIGSMMGSGGLISIDDSACVVDISKFFLGFTVDESCGKCTPCRVGTVKIKSLLDKITSGKAEMSDLDELKELCEYTASTSFCGLGQSAPNPVLSTLNWYKDEYKEHVLNKTCPSKSCKDLIKFVVKDEKCIGCTACARICPAKCIEGKPKEVYIIDHLNCAKCGSCIDACKFDAIEKQGDNI